MKLVAQKSPNPIDIYVGSRVRLRRMMVEMSQEKLADQLGLTFQQVQKYEKGTNRIGASRLYEISQILEVPVQYFFEGISEQVDVEEPDEFEEGGSAAYFMEFVCSSEGIQLNRAYHQIESQRTRRLVLDLIKGIADEAAVT